MSGQVHSPEAEKAFNRKGRKENQDFFASFDLSLRSLRLKAFDFA
jgi:hypothetical protein